ncbi:E3 ubiquitin-protein ligase Rnf220-like isoform X1 [Mercenaria mercenaria]|uniref:E3 ubiquitin-protein ligase Rnf220-like isoform X1 n=2 Tax=Mercenaria mercenaria TaxID=6596 RepID=UPI00234F2741|nr:E3 ubiquitin-protein ligase Rnf220-like isoform X1 [Mercenaria mercenaria]
MQNLHDLAMFRFNFWHKPFLSPPAAHQPFPPGMESTSFIPNPLGAPALMVLASTAENHEGARITGAPRFNSPENKESAPQFSSANYTMYRPGEHFPAPIYAPVHPFVRSATERSGVRLMHPAGSSAFRPLTENPEQYHSAFSPAKRPKPEDLSTKNYTSNIETNENIGNNDFARDLSKEDRPSSLSSVNYDTNSETHSETGEGDRQTPDSEGRSLRKQRKKLILDGQTPHCPICGLTLRPGETETHLQVELEKLDKLSARNVRKSRENTPQGRKTLPSPSGNRGKDSPGVGAASQARYENYLRIQNNRQARLGVRSRTRKKKLEETVCPVCNKKVSGTPEELNEHVELCLKKRDDELEPVDVEADNEQYEEYTWAGQTRIRASSMLDGGYAGSGFQIASCSSQGQDEDCDLNVDDDDSEKYGKPQYSEVDVIPCASDEPNEDREREALRGAFLSTADAPTILKSHSRLTNTDIEGAYNPEDSVSSHIKCEPHDDKESVEVGGSAGQIITALRCRLKEKDEKQISPKCLICMEPYNKPVASTQCWHVHCEECWLRTMGAKKLCPQCNMITSPADLRRIYL